jgi:3-phenylpropionate/trans-cinnamate dioxygenase ferredoxin subunit/naphthalene 1,2-dioxygenase system ferredoxin subunit
MPLGGFFSALKDDELQEGSMTAVDVNGVHVLLSRIGGEVHALSGTCTHEEADLGLGMVLEEKVVCPLHLSQFDLRTGEVLNPPATVPLKSFNVKIEDGTVYVEV